MCGWLGSDKGTLRLSRMMANSCSSNLYVAHVVRRAHKVWVTKAGYKSISDAVTKSRKTLTIFYLISSHVCSRAQYFENERVIAMVAASHVISRVPNLWA